MLSLSPQLKQNYLLSDVGLTQAIQVMNVSHIIIITDTIHSAQHIFDSSVHPYQQQFIAILKDLGFFFQKTFI